MRGLFLGVLLAALLCSLQGPTAAQEVPAAHGQEMRVILLRKRKILNQLMKTKQCWRKLLRSRLKRCDHCDSCPCEESDTSDHCQHCQEHWDIGRKPIFQFLVRLTFPTPGVKAAGDWCYTGCHNTPDQWSQIPGAFCGGHRQSPVDIDSSSAVTEPKLHNFIFTNFTARHALTTLENNGHTVKGKVVDSQVEVSGGGLSGSYSVLQFHLHWGDTVEHPGSEHTLDGQRYPMEMHIVCAKKGLMKSEAVMDPEGLTVLAFLIVATDEGVQKPWQDLTSYLDDLTAPASKVNVSHNLSIEDLLGDVDRTKFYRYMGSLTTPPCNETVVWTVFQQPIQIKLFPAKTSISNVYRPTQGLVGRHVYASPSATAGGGGQEHAWCYDNHCDSYPERWHLLPEAFCGGERQSPVNIVPEDAVEDPALGLFTFTNFDNRKAMDYVTNTGHTVKLVLKAGVEVSGGGLDHVYSTLQLHFHWGIDSDDSQGSEHTVDSVRYPMEMHIVNQRKDLSLEEAKKTDDGLAVLGFFIEAVDGEETKSLRLKNGVTESSNASIHEDMSLSDLLGDVDLSSFYRYKGSLTTPTCNEAVVWTIFKEPIRLRAFPREVGYERPHSPPLWPRPAPCGGRGILAVALCSQLRPCGLSAPTDSKSSFAAVEVANSTWCYHDPSCGPAVWPTIVSPQFCNGSRQSPININTETATKNSDLTSFAFKNFDNKSALTLIKNTGHTVQVQLQDVSVSGGNLSAGYNSLQFHLHWGNSTSGVAGTPGSEHSINGMRYPMEMHIVNIKETHNGNVTLALEDPEGLAALGFLIEEDSSSTSSPASWEKLASYLMNITLEDDKLPINASISLDELLTGVDRTKYYRYMGSLTTPQCNEVVVWTVFKDTIKLSKDLIDLFSTTVRIGNSSSILMTNTFRTIQPAQNVSATVDSSSSGLSFNLMSLKMVLAGLVVFKAL
ncbi:hypothetical protein NHX12_024437 [Muraenolepis orangiensis]|uniref:Carbonic anhydrase n=1 Tax=Muraenolepis orangiensis TaxID=630683 RepID=A0A9Q0EI71_9TELE|nr:hypothetical protein NHX12_024437 [Muraenolepis orangiensis]